MVCRAFPSVTTNLAPSPPQFLGKTWIVHPFRNRTMDKNWRAGFVAGLLKRLFTSWGKGLRAFWNDKREEWGTGCSWVDLVLENVVWEWGDRKPSGAASGAVCADDGDGMRIV